MKVLKSWLKDHIDFNYKNSELADLLSLSGTAVESYTNLDEKIIVAEIKEIEKHPNADKLQITKIFTGKEIIQVVCGANNIEVGQIVPLAQIGSKMSEGFEIKQAQIRGVDSYGMLCATDELGLGTDHSGIMILDDTYEIGKPLADYIDVDAVFDLETTANRGDEQSHIGIAREIAALRGKNLNEKVLEESFMPKDKGLFSVEVQNDSLCPQYVGALIENVKIEDSPEWLQKRLIAIGQKSINNIVDITNYVMLDSGQPIHAFDADKIQGKKIIVRIATKDEKIVTLDGKEYALPESTLVIANTKEPIAIAGVMGGKNSEIDANTKNIILESAEFDSVSIRRTSKKINLSTDASYRFERKIDSGKVQRNLLIAIDLIKTMAKGEVREIIYKGLVPAERKIKIEYEKINNLLGTDLTKEKIDQILMNLGFVVNSEECVIPLWRQDVSIWQDLAEEVARIYGLGNIKHADVTEANEAPRQSYYYKEYIKDLLVGQGFSEIYSYAFLSQKDLDVIGLKSDDLLEISNPIQAENKFLRNSLVPSLLKAVAKNPTFDSVHLFEIGHVFNKIQEDVNLCLASSGKNAKKYIQNAVDEIVTVSGINIEIKELSRDELDQYNIRKPVTYYVEINIEEILKKMKDKKLDLELKISSTEIKYRPVSKYASVVRDLAFVIDKEVESEKIKNDLLSFENVLLVDLFDEFESDKLGIGKKNLAYHIWLQGFDKQMNNEEAQEIINIITEKIETKYKAKLRD